MPNAMARWVLPSGWAEEHDVAGLGEVGAGGQVVDLVALGPEPGGEGELLDRLAGGEPGRADPGLGPRRFPAGHLSGEDRGQVVLVGPALGAGLLGQTAGAATPAHASPRLAGAIT